MKEIKCIDDIKNGWLVVVRDGRKYIKVDGVLVGNCGGYLDAEDYGSGLKIDTYSGELEDFDIVEVWKMRYKDTTLSFDLEDRELVWKEQEQKYYIKHRWLDVETKSGYVNYIKELNCVALYDKTYYSEYQTQFTASEIEELKEKYNTTLEDFKIIPVKEI